MAACFSKLGVKVFGTSVIKMLPYTSPYPIVSHEIVSRGRASHKIGTAEGRYHSLGIICPTKLMYWEAGPRVLGCELTNIGPGRRVRSLGVPLGKIMG